MSMYNLIEYSDTYSKTSRILWEYCKDELAFGANAITNSFNIKVKITGKTGNNGTKDVEIMVLLKYLSNSWRTLIMPLINCEINLDLNWSKKCNIVAINVVNQVATYSRTDTKLYVLVVTLSIQDNAKLPEQLKSVFKRIINRNKYQSKISTERPNQYLEYLIDQIFQGVNSL